MLTEAKSLPISIAYLHGDPIHSTTIWVDADYVIRAVEASDNTLSSQGMTMGSAQLPASKDMETGDSFSDAELEDEVLDKLEKALQTIGQMSAQVVLEISRAHDELAQIRKRRDEGAREAEKKPILGEKPRVLKKEPKAHQTKPQTGRRNP